MSANVPVRAIFIAWVMTRSQGSDCLIQFCEEASFPPAAPRRLTIGRAEGLGGSMPEVHAAVLGAEPRRSHQASGLLHTSPLKRGTFTLTNQPLGIGWKGQAGVVELSGS